MARSLSVPDSASDVAALQALEARYGGHLGLAALNLRTGEEICYNASEQFPTASVIKLAVLAAYYDAVAHGRVNPASILDIRDEDKKPGSGVLQFLSAGGRIALRDAARLMIVVSDNTATNLVLDNLGPDVRSQLGDVNSLMDSLGLHRTKLLNRLFSWQTKQNTGESIRFGVGVSTPEDMVLLMSMIFRHQLIDSTSSSEMLETLRLQQYDDMIPRYLPDEGTSHLAIAHKTGSIAETKVDVGVVTSDSVAFAIAIFVDKSADHSGGIENSATLLGAHVARYVWDRWGAGRDGPVEQYDVDWTMVPHGKWAIYRSRYAPFPHPDRLKGFRRDDGTYYPYFPHYADSSIVVFVPESLRTDARGTNMIVHFHGHGHDNLDILEHSGMVQAMCDQRVNAVLVLPQGPYRARDSFGGKMEEKGGLQRMIEDILRMLVQEGVINEPVLGRLIISAHSGGYRPAAFGLQQGGELEHLDGIFLFDALYGYSDTFASWLEHSNGFLDAAFTEHLKPEHDAFLLGLSPSARKRVSIVPAGVEHEQVVPAWFPRWVQSLGKRWHW